MTEQVNTTVFAGSEWEKKVGYCRARRVNQFVYVSGVVAADGNGQVVGKDAGEQTEHIMQIISKALDEYGNALHCTPYCVPVLT